MLESILLVGGKGTRLRPLTINHPKPMLPVAGVPCTEHQIARAREAGLDTMVGSMMESELGVSSFSARLDCLTSITSSGRAAISRSFCQREYHAVIQSSPESEFMMFGGVATDSNSGVAVSTLYAQS